MTPKQFKIVKELFDVVCDLPEDARRARLLEQTDDQEVIDEVLRLAGQTSIRTTRFSTPIMSAMGAMGALAGDELKAGDKLGAWTLEKEIGHGGMGAVYLAKRSDGHFEQTAAVKLIYGVPSSAALEYLARERQILADLSHPNIARLIDGGATPMGQPYLVMEHIDGVPINRYITGNKLASNQVLVLFKQVFAAVSFAHAQLIVHCDLKPSNILVTQSGRPYLLDFGIAKLVDSANIVDALSNRSSVGSSAPLAYTPHYASPEQREGAPVSIKTDIYALGVMLRESIVDQPDDLRAIVTKATASSREQRYESVAALSDDVDRYLANEPVSARKATATYRAQKFAQRRWPWVLVGAVFAGTVVVFTLRLVAERDRAKESERVAVDERGRAEAAQTQAERDRDRATSAERATAVERDRATVAETRAVQDRDRATNFAAAALSEKNRATLAETKAVAERNRALQAEAASKQTSDFLVSIFNNSNPNAESGDPPASKLIAKAETRIEQELAGQPETQADLYSTLGQVRLNMGNAKQAQQNLQKAIEIERTRQRPLVLASMLDRMAQLTATNFGAKQAEAFASEALALRERYSPTDSKKIAESLATLGGIVTRLGKKEDSENLLLRALALFERAEPGGAGTAETLHLLAMQAVRFDQLDKANVNFERSLAIRARTVGENHPDYLSTLEEHANLLNMTRRYAEAEAALQRALVQRRRLHGNQSEKVAFNLNVLGSVVNRQGRQREAIELYREALSIVDKTIGKRSMAYASILNNLAIPTQNIGDLQAAEAAYAEAMQIFEALWPDTDLTLARVRYNVGRIRTELDDLVGAEPMLVRSLQTRLKTLGNAHGDVIESRVAMMGWYLKKGQLANARAEDELLKPLLPFKDVFVRIDYERRLALLATLEGRMDDARSALAAAERLTQDTYGEADIRTWRGRIARAEWLTQYGSNADKLAGVQLAREILRNLTGRLEPGSPVINRLQKLIAP